MGDENVAEHEKEEGLRLIDAFEMNYGCPLAEFIDVVFNSQ